jgi:peptidoglycan/xylan/chitin deacetylase (PgdA/CDA1 family)
MLDVTDAGREISRRALLGIGAYVALSGCGTYHGPQARAAASTTEAPPTPGPPPSREHIVATYAGVTPKEWGLSVTGMTLSLGAAAVKDKAFALTFDACGAPQLGIPGSGVDRALIDFLRANDIPATLFLNKRWIEENADYANELAADPLFEIGSHGTRHLPLSVSGQSAYGSIGTLDPGDAYDEVVGNIETFTKLTGHAPRWFRSGTAHCDEVAVQIVHDIGQQVVNFAVNADWGTTATAEQVAQNLDTVKPGDIVISHMNRPEHETAEGYERGLAAVLAKGLKPVKLSEYLV